MFIPPPPEKARLQVLLTFSSEDDLRPSRSRLSAFLGKKETRGRELGKPYAAVMRGSKVYVTDTALHSVVVVDLRRRRFEQLAGDEGMGKLKMPINLAFDEAGVLYVADTARGEVLAYDPSGRYLRSYGDNKMLRPSGVAVSRGRLYVSDVRNHVIRVLDTATGKELQRFGGPGQEPGQTGFPSNIAVDAEGNTYVSETLTGRVQKFSVDGGLLQSFGHLGARLGELVRPKGIAVDRRGNLYVVDAANEHAQIFDKAGRLLLAFGGNRDTLDSLVLPSGISITYDPASLEVLRDFAALGFSVEYGVIVVSQYGKRRISVFGFGTQR